MLTEKESISFQLLKELVKKMDDAYWSSWQSTGKFQEAWDEAREFIQEKANEE
jgi:hypothetical protein